MHHSGREDGGGSGERWLEWARRIAALAQNGLTYTDGVFDRERYQELQEIAAAMLATGGQGDAERILRLLRVEEGYATPKVDVRGIVFREGKLLLVREVEDGRWAPPGGWADAGETPSEAVQKEILEESGFATRAVKVLAVYDRDRHGVPPLIWPVYKMFIRCEITGGAAAGSVETSEVGFFAEDALPALSQGRATEAQLRRMFRHLREPLLPTEFD